MLAAKKSRHCNHISIGYMCAVTFALKKGGKVGKDSSICSQMVRLHARLSTRSILESMS